jgi:putative effector of murein hydrolase
VTGAGGETIFERRSKFGAKPEKRGPGQSRGREKTGVKDPETRNIFSEAFIMENISSVIAISATFGVVISIIGYWLGVVIRNKTGLSVCNPLLISIIFVIVILSIFHINYSDYNKSARYLSYLLTPATVSLAIPLYLHIDRLKRNWVGILVGLLAGSLTSMGSVLAMSVLFRLSHQHYVTLLPKSITTAIGMSVSDELGGVVTISVAVIIVTGILGNVIAVSVLKLFRITDLSPKDWLSAPQPMPSERPRQWNWAISKGLWLHLLLWSMA